MTLFTGSSHVAEKLASDLNGRIKLEDAGFDWKILGPDVQEVPTPPLCKHYNFPCSMVQLISIFIFFIAG